MRPKYFSLNELTQMMPSPNFSICQQIVEENRDLFRRARGSTHNHQAWPGGYMDHVVEAMNLWVLLYTAFDSTGRLPQLPLEEQFSMGDGLLVLFVHDLEKPWRCEIVEGEIVVRPELKDKKARKSFVVEKLNQYGLSLTSKQQNALKYVEGMRDADYSPGDRVMLPLAVLCHCCDLLSARLFYDFPLEVDDAWGAKRAVLS